MSTPLAQAQNEGLCLRYPESAGMHREITLEAAVGMLLRAAHVAQTVPFTWGYVDKPSGKFSLSFGCKEQKCLGLRGTDIRTIFASGAAFSK